MASLMTRSTFAPKSPRNSFSSPKYVSTSANRVHGPKLHEQVDVALSLAEVVAHRRAEHEKPHDPVPVAQGLDVSKFGPSDFGVAENAGLNA